MWSGRTLTIEKILAIATTPLPRPREITEELGDLCQMIVIPAVSPPFLVFLSEEQKIRGQELKHLNKK